MTWWARYKCALVADITRRRQSIKDMLWWYRHERETYGCGRLVAAYRAWYIFS